MLTEDEILISLDCEPADFANPEIRASIKEVSCQLEKAGLSPRSLIHARSGVVTASVTSLGPYLLPIAHILIPALGAIFIAWVKSPGRKIRIKVGDMRIEATSVEDIERLIPHLKELQSRKSKGGRKNPEA